MSTSDPAPPAPPTSESTILERLLASEGRNALSRVELAASELARSEWTPVLADRILSIREAVVELEDVFDRIERLASPRPAARSEIASDVDAAWRAVRVRIAPVLRTRGIALESVTGALDARVAIAPIPLERVLLLGLRLVTATLEREEHEPCDVVSLAPFACLRDRTLELELSCSGMPVRVVGEPVVRGLQLDLEVALAEWGGGVVSRSANGSKSLVLRLPRSESHA